MSDLEIIRELENVLGREIQQVDEPNYSKSGYKLGKDNRVIGLSLIEYGIKDLSPLVSLLRDIKGLTALYLGRNQISDISPLKDLSNLKLLSLDYNQISNLLPLKSLPNLIGLSLGNNQITDLSPLKSLGKLEALAIGNNQIRSIAPLKDLTNLDFIFLSKNQIRDISPLKYLKRLKWLILDRNEIEILPSWITDFDTSFEWEEGELKTWGTGIYLYGNPLKDPPPEIVMQGKEAIKAWFGGEKIFVNEIKVLLVGHGEVGKTSLVKRLTGEEPDPKELPTHYIRITSHTVSCKEKDIKLNFWDFGGQEVMHSTHQFFLSKRSVYLLVLDGRRDEDPEYWLKHIESFGGESPVLVVLNKIDTNPGYDVDRRFLKDKYKFIVGFHKTACFGNIQGISELQESLKNALDEVEILKTEWRKDWLPVKESLEVMNDDFISQREYEKLCESNAITDDVAKETLAGYLNDLGVVVHFKDIELSDLHILQPRWASRAAYKIINSKTVAENHGLLDVKWLHDIMKKEDENDFTYRPDTFRYILDLMQKFELCYALKQNNQYLVPELLDIQQPVLPVHTGPVLRFYFQYDDILPRSIMPRFIVRMHEDIKGDLRWRTGVVLSVPIFGSTAIVIADVKDKKINVSVSGPRRREHFATIRKTFHSLKKSFEKLNVTEWIPLPDVENYAVEYDELIGYEENKMKDYFAGKLKKWYKVKDLLDGIEPENVRKGEYQWEVFLCYSTQDKTLVRQIANDLSGRSISYWLDDEQIEPGDNIIEKITDGLLKSRVIMPCISESQLSSGWSREEYQAILNRIISGTTNQKVVPLILDNTTDKSLPLLLGNIRGERYQIREQYDRLLDYFAREKMRHPHARF